MGVGTLKRRREKLSGDIALIQKLKDDKYIMLSSTKTHVETNQANLSDQQLILDRRQESLQDYIGKTQEQATRRFDMIGEFEEEIVKLSDSLAKQSLHGTLKRFNNSLNKVPTNEKGESELNSFVAEAERLEKTLANIKGGSKLDIKDKINDCSRILSVFSGGYEKIGKALSSNENELNLSFNRKDSLLMSSN